MTNDGTLMPSIAAAITARSAKPARRAAATTPTATPASSARTIAAPPSVADTRRVRPMISLTDCERSLSDGPRSPVTARPSQRANCTGAGASRPYFSSSAAFTSGASARSLANGPPGAARTSANEIAHSTSRTAGAWRKRSSAYLSIGRDRRRASLLDPHVLPRVHVAHVLPPAADRVAHQALVDVV